MKEYKRFTERAGNGISVKETSTNDNKSIWNAIERLAELEDKIEQGKMLELPCKVGDRIWIIQGNNIFGRKVRKIELYHTFVIQTCDKTGWKELESFYEQEFNTTWFLTKAEAEAKLKELQEKG